MFEIPRYVLLRIVLSLADRVITSPLLAWTWSGAPEHGFPGRLTEFRPTDGQTVAEMMAGQYLLGGQLVETGGVSPFALDVEPGEWLNDLHSFGWLRHFQALRDEGQRRFARTLVLDWIGRYGQFDHESWDVMVTARRVLNWLKNYDLLVEAASAEHRRTIDRSLASQVQSLKLRQALCANPMPQLMARLALVGASLSSPQDEKGLPDLVARLERMLVEHCDADGLHLSRNPLNQIRILSELIPISRLLDMRHPRLGTGLAQQLDRMQRAFEALVLGTREPAYMNGCGQAPVELVLAIAAQSGVRNGGSRLCGGYGVLVDGSGKLVADSGRVPPLAFAADAHAGAMSFEFSSGGLLIAGNCGPAPAQLPESHNLFRHSSAHSAPTIDDRSSAEIGGGSLLGDALRPRGAAPTITLMRDENGLEMVCPAYRVPYGLDIVRRLTLMGDGQTLVGQDRFMAGETRSAARPGVFSIRFHLAPGAEIERKAGEGMIRLHFRTGEIWAFLWEGAEVEIEESVRHSAHLGLLRTWQIVLLGEARPDTEVAWVFTRQ